MIVAIAIAAVSAWLILNALIAGWVFFRPAPKRFDRRIA